MLEERLEIACALHTYFSAVQYDYHGARYFAELGGDLPSKLVAVFGKRGRRFSATLIRALCQPWFPSEGQHHVEKTFSVSGRSYPRYRRLFGPSNCGRCSGQSSRSDKPPV